MARKLDDAAFYTAAGATEEQAIAHVALFFRWCVERGWVGEDHTEDEESARELARARRGQLTFSDYLWDNVSGKFSTDDLTPEGAEFAKTYYEDFASDLARHLGKNPLTFTEREVDFESVRVLLDARFVERRSPSRERPKSWWRFW